MNGKIFASTFVLIFLAELGDKTQLAAMARAASSGSARWTIFVAASSALVVSTLIAVLFGSVITKYIPERYIKAGAGALFLVFGALILREALGGAKVAAAAAEVKGVTAFVFRQAAAFEKAAFEDYRRLASRARHPDLKALLEALAAEEDAHFRHLATVQETHADLQLAVGAEAVLPSADALRHDVSDEDRPVVAHAIEHERATANFYAELARLTPIPALKQAFQTLAAAETQHVRRLAAFGDGSPA